MVWQYFETLYGLTVYLNLLWFGKAHPLSDHICLCCGICLVLLSKIVLKMVAFHIDHIVILTVRYIDHIVILTVR